MAQLHVDVHDGRGPYALLVHGILSSRAQWAPNLDALKTVSRPVVVELLGHGRSPSPTGPGPYTPDGYVRAFEEIRRDLGAEHWFVVGQSLGAALTLRYALAHQERVVAQVFTNSSSALADDEWRRGVQATLPDLARRVEEGGRDLIARLPLHPARARHVPRDAHRALVADGDLIDPGGLARTFLHTVPDSSVRDRVAANRVRTLLVAGGREREFAPSRSHAEATMPHLEVVELDAGHAVNLQAAEAFDAAVTAFLAAASAAAPATT